MESVQRSFWRDALWVGLYCLVLFGFAGFSGRPLTMHEARLPETSREMMQHHNWLLPTSGGRPWLERPPLPHWFVIASMKIFGHVDRVWIVRLPSAVMGALTVLLTMYIARKWFDPPVAVMAGCVLATSFKFYQYATLAEDDIFLAAMVALAAALFTYAELSPATNRRRGWWSFFSNRPWAILGFFVVLGLSNLARGPLLGIIYAGVPVGIYCSARAAIDKSPQQLFRYTWLWGWLLLIGLTIWWPMWAWHRYPGVLENFKYDYLGRMSGTYAAINEPWWFYPPVLLGALVPWAPVCVAGAALSVLIVVTAVWPGRATRTAHIPAATALEGSVLDDRKSGRDPGWHYPPKFFRHDTAIQQLIDRESASGIAGYLWILCWAFVPLLVLSIPKGKHDHYVVPFLAPWAILGSIGLVAICRLIRVVLTRTLVATLLLVTMLVLLIGYCAGEAFLAARTDHTLADTAFLIRCRSEVPASAKLFIDGKLGPPGNLDFFRIQFYSRPDAVLLHNLSFLRAKSITAPVVYVIARRDDQRLLAQLGTVHRIDASSQSHQGDQPRKSPVGNFTLYRLTFFPGLARYRKPARISSLQAMERAPGPWCGPPLQ